MIKLPLLQKLAEGKLKEDQYDNMDKQIVVANRRAEVLHTFLLKMDIECGTLEKANYDTDASFDIFDVRGRLNFPTSVTTGLDGRWTIVQTKTGGLLSFSKEMRGLTDVEAALRKLFK